MGRALQGGQAPRFPGGHNRLRSRGSPGPEPGSPGGKFGPAAGRRASTQKSRAGDKASTLDRSACLSRDTPPEDRHRRPSGQQTARRLHPVLSVVPALTAQRTPRAPAGRPADSALRRPRRRAMLTETRRRRRRRTREALRRRPGSPAHKVLLAPRTEPLPPAVVLGPPPPPRPSARPADWRISSQLSASS